MTLLILLSIVFPAAGPDALTTAEPAPDTVAADRYAGNACVQCHRNLAGRSAEIVDLEWARSVHYENDVACDGCHGGDASVQREEFPTEEAFKEAAHLSRNPEFLHLHASEGVFVSRARGRSVSYFCGRCHREIMEKHLGSPHGDFGDPSCLFCHGRGSHGIQPASLDIIDPRPRTEAGRCSLCHQASTMEVVADIRQTLAQASETIAASAEQFERLQEMGYRNLALADRHEHTAETRSQLKRVFHSFNLREINELVRSIDAVAAQTDYAHQLVQSLHQARRRQTIIGLVAVVFLLAFAGLLVYYKHAFCEDYDRSAAEPSGDDAKGPSEVTRPAG